MLFGVIQEFLKRERRFSALDDGKLSWEHNEGTGNSETQPQIPVVSELYHKQLVRLF